MEREVWAQIIGILGMAANIWSYQQKSKMGVIVLQFGGAVLFTFNFLLLGAITGTMLNGINILLSAVFLLKDRVKADHVGWAILFFALYTSAYVMTFTVFGMKPTVVNFAREALPLLGTYLTVISYRKKDAGAIRKLGLIRSPAWLVYDALVFSIGGVICEVISLVSIVAGIIRFDIKKKTS
jgi:hypothetical protein